MKNMNIDEIIEKMEEFVAYIKTTPLDSLKKEWKEQEKEAEPIYKYMKFIDEGRKLINLLIFNLSIS